VNSRKKRRAISDLSFWERISLLLGLLIVVVFIVGMLEPIPQDPNYHLFADNQSFFGISNFNDVVSNIGFDVVGLLGTLVVALSTY